MGTYVDILTDILIDILFTFLLVLAFVLTFLLTFIMRRYKRREKVNKKHCAFHRNRQQSATFSENPCAKTQKTKKNENPLVLLHVCQQMGLK